MQFGDENHFDPIHLNFALGEENNGLKGNITELITYKTCYKDVNNEPVLLPFVLGKYVAVNSIIG